jgi:hypothetical protein
MTSICMASVLSARLRAVEAGGRGYLEGPKRVLDIRYVPKERDDCDVENNYAQRYSLRVVHGQTTS